MKKIFSLLLLAMAFVSAWAADETIVFSNLYSSNTTLDDVTISGTDFSLVFQKRSGGTATQYYTNGTAVRWYGGGTLVVSSTTKTISKIEITYTQTANTVSTNVGTYSLDNSVGTWTGSASSITFTQSGTSGQCRISAIAVTYEGGSEPPVQPTYETVTIPYTEALISSQGKFVIEDVELGGLSAVWTTSQYGMTANGYQCTDDIESWFVSPLIDATSVSAVNLNFDESLNYFTNDVAEEASLWVREGEDGEWVNVTIPTHTLDANNQWHNTGDIDLSAYAGKVFQLGFKYTAIVGSPGRWEIKNLEVTEGVVENAKVTTVGEFNALETGADFDFTGTGLVATAQKGSYLYAQDATGGMLIYGNVGQTYAKGAVIPAGFTATKAEYYGAPQAGSPTGFTASSTTADVTAKEMTAADFAATTFADYQANFGLYAVVRGVTVEGNTMTLADGTTTVATYTTFATVPESTSGKTYDVYGIMGWHNGLQFLPTEYVQMATTAHAAPTITVNPDQETYFVGDEVTVKFTSEETDVNIGYDITDAETFPENYCVPVSNGDSITVTANEPKTVNVRAFAYGYNEGDALGNSEVVTKTLTFVAKPELGDQYELVTSADQIAAGKEYVLAYSNENVTVAMGAAVTYGTNHVHESVNAGATEFTLENDIITLMSSTTVAPFTLETSATEGYYNIKIDGDQYLNWESGNTVVTGETKGDVTVALDSVGNAVVKLGDNRFLQYNSSSPRFAFYTGTQKYPQLYVKVAATPDVKLGDVNGDGDVNVNDVTVLINYILGKNPTPFVEANANVNGDEGINVNDVTALINMILN